MVDMEIKMREEIPFTFYVSQLLWNGLGIGSERCWKLLCLYFYVNNPCQLIFYFREQYREKCLNYKMYNLTFNLFHLNQFSRFVKQIAKKMVREAQ